MANRDRRVQVISSRARPSIDDPLAARLRPPANESPQDRDRRVRAEDDARKRSETIDKMIRRSEKERSRKQTVKVLLLGQSESGKSTTLKRQSPRSLFSFLFAAFFYASRVCAPVSRFHIRPYAVCRILLRVMCAQPLDRFLALD